MRIHFSSKKECFLRIGGIVMGSCGTIEKFIEVEENCQLLVEFLPEDGNLLPISFVINSTFFESPPECCKVYFYGVGADIVAYHFQPRKADLQIVKQLRVGNLLATCVRQQTMQLLLEDGKNFESIALPYIDDYTLEEIQLGEEKILLFCYTHNGQQKLLILNQQCKILLESFYTEYTVTDKLQISLQYNDLAGHTLQQTYVMHEKTLQLQQNELLPKKNFCIEGLHSKLLPFAFFQTLLIGGDIAPYLAPHLQDKTELLKEYLGAFIEVQIPKDIFYYHYGDINAVALVYKKTESLYTVQFFVAEIENDKICNLQAVE